MAKHLQLYLLLMVLAGTVISCNSNSDTDPTVLSSSVAVKTFSLADDDSVLSNLDSVFFTIDLDKKLIYNADSLPKGTNITKLVANITFPLVTSATIQVKDGKVMSDSTINYATNSTDSIDFTGNVKLTIVSEDGTNTGVYTLKVNVHNMDPDSLYWNKIARRDLPSISNPIAQKTVEYKGLVNCLVKESNKYLLSTVDNPSNVSAWKKSVVNFSFNPNINTFTATDDALYILSDNGDLYKSTTGLDWVSCDTKMYSLIGGYNNTLLAVTNINGVYYHSYYPASAGQKSPIEEGFPINNFSNQLVFDTDWSTSSQLLIMGGIDKEGSSTGECWGYDGSSWGQVSAQGITPFYGGTIIPYYTYKVNGRWIATKYTTLLAIGGVVDGKVSKSVYISRDFGVTWKLGDDLLQLPDYIPAFKDAQAVVLPTVYTSRSYDGWQMYNSKKLPVWNFVIPAVSSRYDISWDCPYIYMFGGTNINGELYNNIWKGVLNRLSFKPLI